MTVHTITMAVKIQNHPEPKKIVASRKQIAVIMYSTKIFTISPTKNLTNEQYVSEGENTFVFTLPEEVVPGLAFNVVLKNGKTRTFPVSHTTTFSQSVDNVNGLWFSWSRSAFQFEIEVLAEKRD